MYDDVSARDMLLDFMCEDETLPVPSDSPFATGAQLRATGQRQRLLSPSQSPQQSPQNPAPLTSSATNIFPLSQLPSLGKPNLLGNEETCGRPREFYDRKENSMIVSWTLSQREKRVKVVDRNLVHTWHDRRNIDRRNAKRSWRASFFERFEEPLPFSGWFL